MTNMTADSKINLIKDALLQVRCSQNTKNEFYDLFLKAKIENKKIDMEDYLKKLIQLGKNNNIVRLLS